MTQIGFEFNSEKCKISIPVLLAFALGVHGLGLSCQNKPGHEGKHQTTITFTPDPNETELELKWVTT